jgi:hypothetical protein
MDRRDMMGHNKVLQIHQASDGEPAIYPGWPFNIASLALALKVAHPHQELNRKPRIQSKKRKLHRVANPLGTVRH